MTTPAEFNENFKESPIGLLPQDWEIRQLNDIADIVMGQSPPSDTYNKLGTGLPFMQGKAEFGSTYPKPIQWCSKSQRIAQSNSILVSVRAPVGDVNVADQVYCIGRGLASLSGRELLDNQYLFFSLLYSKNRLMGLGTGTTFQSINKATLHSFPIPLPPLPEQCAIAETLSAVRRDITTTEAVIAAAHETKRALMKHLFTYGAVPVAQTASVPLQETEIGDVPEGWKVVSLGDVAEIYSGGTPARNKPEYWNGNIPWVRTGEINYNVITKTGEMISDKGYRNSSARLIPAGTLLMAMYGEGVTRGRVAILGIEATINQACAALFLSASITTEFLLVLPRLVGKMSKKSSMFEG